MTKRDFYFDNAKFILIFFVVFGHFIRSYINDNELIFALYASIFLFHMPGFILVSGFFAKSFYKKGYVKKITKKILLPFFIFQLVYSIFYFFLYQEEAFEVDLLIPHWSLWFLLSLFFWNILLLIVVKWLKLSPAVSITIAVILGLAIGCLENNLSVLSVGRTFIYFPFFLVGYYLQKEHFAFLSNRGFKSMLLAGSIVIFIIAYINSDFDQRWLLGSSTYTELGIANWQGVITRAWLYVLNFFMIAAFFAFVPRKKFFFTDWGKNTLYVYLLHGFFIKSFRDSEFVHSAESVVLMLTASLFLTMLLSSSVVTTIAQPLIEARWTKIKQIFSSKTTTGKRQNSNKEINSR